ISGIEDVTKRSAAAGMEGQRSEARLLADFVKGTITIIAMEEERLAITGTGLQRVNLRIHMAVGYKNVQPGIVVHVKESRAPAHIRIAGMSHSGSPAHIIETLGAEVAI